MSTACALQLPNASELRRSSSPGSGPNREPRGRVALSSAGELVPVLRPRHPGMTQTPTRSSSSDQRPAAEEAIGLQLAKAAVAAKRVFTSQIARVYGVGRAEVAILRALVSRPGILASDLVDALGIAPPGVSLHVESLEKRNLVERRPGTKDKRTRALFATSQGRALAGEVMARLAQAEADAFGLSPSETTVLTTLLSQINASSAARAAEKVEVWLDLK